MASAVFLSYASQDAEPARRIAEALRGAGVDVWFDQSELVGGDAWDQKIRKQIRECALLIPVISANTQQRTEGYFRLEWRLADQRTHLMAKGRPFLLPVVIDDTRDSDAHVPDSFTEVQWTRLPGGETTPAFAGRVRSLLAAPVAGVADPGRARRDEPPGSPPPATGRTPKWLKPVLASAAIVIAVLAFNLMTRRTPEVSPAPAAAKSGAASLSPARELVAKAWAQLNKPQLFRAELEIAEEFAKRATELDSSDAEAWAVASQVDSWFVLHAVDATSPRREAARSKAAKAVQLAPSNYEARLAQACYFVRGGGDLVAATNTGAVKALLLSLLQERRDEPRALFALATLQNNAGQATEARSTYERLAANPEFAVVAWNEIGWADLVGGRYAEAEIAAGKSVALYPYWGNLTLQALLAIWWRGDLDLAKSIYDRIPADVRLEDHGVADDCLLFLFRREPDAILRLLEGVPRDWLHSNAYDGPKALWAALAQDQLGRPDRARLQWQAALTQIERRLAEHPDADDLLRLKASALAALGQSAEADQTLRLARDYVPGGVSQSLLRDVATQVRSGHPDAALDLLEHAPRLTAAACRLAPQLDALRSHPRFQALLARLEADPRASPKAAPASGSTAVDQKSVAVLAFANLSDDRGNEYFSDGISEELLNVLAKVPGLKVSARTSAFFFKGKEVPVPEIAKQLGVAYIVEGSVRKQGDKVRITAQLIKAADGFHVWSDTFTRDLKDIFAVQDEIAGLIAQNLKLSMGLAIPVARRAVDPEAHRLLLEGRYFWNQRTMESLDRADAALRNAIEIDPDFAEAHAALADVRWIRTVYNTYSGANYVPGNYAGTETARALALAPMLAEAYPAAGAALQWAGRAAEGEQLFLKAIALNPNYALAHHWYSLVLEGQGRLDEALAEIDRALQLDPLSLAALSTRGRFLCSAGRMAEALATFEKVLALRKDYFFSTGNYAQALLALGRHEEALAVARSICNRESMEIRYVSDALAVSVLRALGHEAEAVAHIERLLARLPADSYLRGVALVSVDRFDEALPFLERTPPGLTEVFYWNMVWDRWRSDPRFLRLLAKLNCTEEYKAARASLARMQSMPGGAK